MRVASKLIVSGKNVAMRRFVLRKKVSINSSASYRLFLKKKAKGTKAKVRKARKRA